MNQKDARSGQALLVSLTKEQLDRAQPVSDERLRAAFQAGKAQRDAAECSGQTTQVIPKLKFR